MKGVRLLNEFQTWDSERFQLPNQQSWFIISAKNFHTQKVLHFGEKRAHRWTRTQQESFRSSSANQLCLSGPPLASTCRDNAGLPGWWMTFLRPPTPSPGGTSDGPPLLLTFPAIPSATDAGPPTAPRHKRGLSNLLGSGGKTDPCWKGIGAKWEPWRALIYLLRREDAHELQIEVSAPQIFPGRKALQRLNSFSLPLRSLIFYTQADNKEKKQESERAGAGFGGEWLGPKSQKRSKCFWGNTWYFQAAM